MKHIAETSLVLFLYKEPLIKQPTTETLVGGGGTPPVVEYFWVCLTVLKSGSRQPEEANTVVKVHYHGITWTK